MAGKWISTKKKLPDFNQKVLGVINTTQGYIYQVIDRDYYTAPNNSVFREDYKEGWAWYGDIMRVPPKLVKAWMPIPKYEEGGSDDSKDNGD